MSDNALHRAIDSILVGTRHRDDLGDLTSLAESIRRLGLLQPVTVTPDGLLICGHRRLEAARQLGWTTIPVHVRSGISTHLAALLAEREENTQRKPLNPVEESKLYDEILVVEREEAARRQAATRFHPGHHDDAHPGEHDTSEGEGETGNSGSGNLPEPLRPGDARHKAAVLVTGKAAYKRLERVSALRTIADDDAATPVVRELAALAVEDIQAGAPVFPTYDQAMTQIAALDPTRPAIRAVTAYDLADTAREAIDRVTSKATVKGAKKRRGTGTKVPTGQPFARTLRAWVQAWRDLAGLDTTNDPTTIAARIPERDWNQFERVVDEINAFRGTVRAARHAGG